ncbi:MAG: SGNH/GDSL hydrolase family protein [Limnochordia bacterium]|jgi:lysophospholipase L1-like esterase
MTAHEIEGSGLVWYDVREWGVEGRGWDDVERYYDRLPARAKGVVRDPVWNLSKDSAGMCTCFITDAPEIHARWRLRSARLAMSHMPATGVSGLDLYVRDESAGVWRWLGIGRPEDSVEAQSMLAVGLDGSRRSYLLYLPLYNGVESLEIGVPSNACFEPVAPRTAKPVVFYGTSIVQGACASRPGMHHVAILGRRLDCPVINLGFSGNGRMEPEVGRLLAELDPAVYVIDCLPNMSVELVSERVEPLVRALREARPTAPIVLIGERYVHNVSLLPERRRVYAQKAEAFHKALERLTQAGVEGFHVIPGEPLLGDDGEGTVDGSHPTDLGFWRMADVLEPVLAKLL